MSRSKNLKFSQFDILLDENQQLPLLNIGKTDKGSWGQPPVTLALSLATDGWDIAKGSTPRVLDLETALIVCRESDESGRTAFGFETVADIQEYVKQQRLAIVEHLRASESDFRQFWFGANDGASLYISDAAKGGSIDTTLAELTGDDKLTDEQLAKSKRQALAKPDADDMAKTVAETTVDRSIQFADVADILEKWADVPIQAITVSAQRRTCSVPYALCVPDSTLGESVQVSWMPKSSTLEDIDGIQMEDNNPGYQKIYSTVGKLNQAVLILTRTKLMGEPELAKKLCMIDPEPAFEVAFKSIRGRIQQLHRLATLIVYFRAAFDVDILPRFEMAPTTDKDNNVTYVPNGFIPVTAVDKEHLAVLLGKKATPKSRNLENVVMKAVHPDGYKKGNPVNVDQFETYVKFIMSGKSTRTSALTRKEMVSALEPTNLLQNRLGNVADVVNSILRNDGEATPDLADASRYLDPSWFAKQDWATERYLSVAEFFAMIERMDLIELRNPESYLAFDEPVADEPVADEPVADEPVADEPVAS